MPSTNLMTQATQESQGEQGRSDDAHAHREDPHGGSEARASTPDRHTGRARTDQPLRGVSTMGRMRGRSPQGVIDESSWKALDQLASYRVQAVAYL